MYYLIENATGACLLPGAVITDFRGADHVYRSVRSDGRRIVVGQDDLKCREFFPTVFPGVRVCRKDD